MPRYVGERSLGYSIFAADDTENNEIIGSKCPVCGDVRFPARVLCPNDLAECERHPVAGQGIIYEVVRVRLAPEGFKAPYWVGYVDLADGVRIFAQIAAADDERAPANGDRVRMTVGVVGTSDNEPVYGPVFRKVADADF
jgi:uncharacterized protein